MRWSEQAWESIQPIYNSIIKMPFITEMKDGSLPLDKFRFYMQQDACYLEHFARALALVSARAVAIDDVLTFIRFAENAIVVENALHESYFNDFGVSGRVKPEPACHHYIHFLKSTAALDSVEIAMAAVLPCFWIYKRVGDHIYATQSPSGNPYKKWIDTYAGEEFGEAVKLAIGICDKVAGASTAAGRSAMTEAFIAASRLEFDFWDAAYKLRRW
ncbi:MAG: thiaminase II [Citrobacter freundii]|nr:MAG: thiaminase II [Citrobacter freundii]